MSLTSLIASLHHHAEIFPTEKIACDRTIAWIEQYGEFAFVKANHEWHVTATLMVLNEKKDKMLLMLHKKLQLWVGFGGHCDGEIDARSVAIREFHEESGSMQAPYVFPEIFHVDVHDIPVDAKWTPPHMHFDVLFLASISDDTPLSRQEKEVDDIGWFTFDEVIGKNPEPLMQAMVQKIRNL